MITEDYVSFEIGKLLKEKGFSDYGCLYSYMENGGTKVTHWENELNLYPKPTLQMAMKWLREVHNIGIFPSLFAFCVGKGGVAKPTYGTKIISLKSCELLTDDTNPMPTYEEACEAGIKYCLQNLI